MLHLHHLLLQYVAGYSVVECVEASLDYLLVLPSSLEDLNSVAVGNMVVLAVVDFPNSDWGFASNSHLSLYCFQPTWLPMGCVASLATAGKVGHLSVSWPTCLQTAHASSTEVSLTLLSSIAFIFWEINVSNLAFSASSGFKVYIPPGSCLLSRRCTCSIKFLGAPLLCLFSQIHQEFPSFLYGLGIEQSIAHGFQ